MLLDNIYVDGEVSADGHEWTMGAYATDFVEKMWPLSYRGSPRKTFGYPSEGAIDTAARPAGGYLWDRAAEAKVSYRSYGEWVENGKKNKDGTFEDGKAAVKALEGHFDPKYRGYDSTYPDVKRAERFIDEVKRFEKAGEMPGSDDREAAERPHGRHPRRRADADRAWWPTTTSPSAWSSRPSRKSKFWKDTAIFVIEDDTQNGPDHVDAHRSVALVVSPYTKRKHVDSTLYSTIEHVADDGVDPRLAADEPVRRRGPADVPLVPGQAGPRRIHAREAEDRPERQEQGRRVGGQVVEQGETRPRRTPRTTSCSTR